MSTGGKADVIIAIVDMMIAEADKRRGDERPATALAYAAVSEELKGLRRAVERIKALEADVDTLRARLAAAEKALHKANHENDELRQRLAASEPAAPDPAYPMSILFSRLVDSAEGDYAWVE